MEDKLQEQFNEIFNSDVDFTIEVESEVNHDFVAINNMINIAEREGLLTEVVWSFYNEAKHNEDGIYSATVAALNEWDCL